MEDVLVLLRGLQPLVEFQAPASEHDIEVAERRLGIDIPDDLRMFLRRSDGATTGVELSSGEVVPHATRLVWSVGEIVRNHEAEPVVPRLPGILFFADAGADGILFGHPIYSSSRVGPDVVSWNPRDDEPVPAAPSFRMWLEAWLSGALRV